MKRRISYALLALFGTMAIVIASPDQEAIITKEKTAWKMFKEKNSDEFRKLLSADFHAVYADGVHDLAKEVELMKTMDLKSFSLSDFKVVFPDADTALVTYKAEVTFRLEGKESSGTYNAGSVWRNTKGDWRAIFYTEVKEEKPTQPSSS